MAKTMSNRYSPEVTVTRQEKVDAALKLLAEQVEALSTSEGWRKMLETAAMFHNYSLNNQLLIAIQAGTRGLPLGPAAGFHTWKKLGRSVNKGQSGLAILAPMLAKREVVDETTGRMVERKVVIGFRTVYTWVQAQTSGEELPKFGPELLTGDGPVKLLDSLMAVAVGLGFSVEFGPCGSANGYTRFDTKHIKVRDDVDDAQKCKTLAHELGHVLCGHEKDTSYHWDDTCRGRCEIEAESVAYLVMSWAGADSTSYTVPYVTGWAGGEAEKVRATAEKVRKAGVQLIEKLGPLVDDDWIAGEVSESE